MAVSGMIEALSTQAPRAVSCSRGGVGPGRRVGAAGEAGSVGEIQDEDVCATKAIGVRSARADRRASVDRDGRPLGREAA